MSEALLGAWVTLLAEAGSPAPGERLRAEGEALLQRWAEPHRRYHDLRHLQEVLAALDVLTEPGTPPPAVRLAVWFHDAVYLARPGDDEEDSALLATEVLTGLDVPARTVADVARLVRLTTVHEPGPDDGAGALLVDADLAILAADPDRYRQYATAVRAEYAHVPDDAFAAGRAAVLDRLLQHPALFHTARGRAEWEPAARANLSAELSRLRG